MAGSVNRLVEKLEKSDDMAREADLRARAAHHRIDEMRGQLEAMKQGQRWIITTSFGLIGLASTLLGLVLKFLEGG